MDPSHLDDIIDKLMQVMDTFPPQCIVPKNEVEQLCAQFKEVIMEDKTLMELKAPINVIGDLHGQYTDLVRFLKATNYKTESFLFLGDFVDRGFHSLEVLCLVYALKLRYPKQYFLIRGNHESVEINRVFGFYDECVRVYDESIWKLFNETFAYLPILAIIEKRIFCVHGGISPDLRLPDVEKIIRPLQIPCGGTVCDLLWADPGAMSGWKPNTVRGMSVFFGEDVCEDFMRKNNLELICRGHEAVDGYQFKFNKKLVTLFSSPVYCNSMDNSGAMMRVSSDLKCSFVILKVDK
ncbi:serine/threonine protein phosphatase PP1 isozyme, putative [Entamoeba invadens IP1]|uniref:Serine/threonine-protein phosphatase n=1 Tax=Entamoeba invadens IP1 TaxID=370355 RepID=A0A0A1U6Y8_ENTIV|nr:serine/threonine protein phosphatase PP1 isozyme, putative [Entamoeba invadens IP1]ELP87734.1 serine/threonine protein phosphatase PP1 isozyme, putative [Entamoeba invadens IP1]|eukprot:XP_004254505.1 serine/threonine protein phosphatase PP1 isozyme, putative [Entamoeba invadens IP1]